MCCCLARRFKFYRFDISLQLTQGPSVLHYLVGLVGGQAPMASHTVHLPARCVCRAVALLTDCKDCKHCWTCVHGMLCNLGTRRAASRRCTGWCRCAVQVCECVCVHWCPLLCSLCRWQPFRWLSYSCNGFHEEEPERLYGGIRNLWRDVYARHMQQPFHLQVQEGGRYTGLQAGRGAWA